MHEYLLNISRWKHSVASSKTLLGFTDWLKSNPLNTNVVRPIHGGYVNTISLRENRELQLVINQSNSDLTEALYALRDVNTILDLTYPNHEDAVGGGVGPNNETFQVLGEIRPEVILPEIESYIRGRFSRINNELATYIPIPENTPNEDMETDSEMPDLISDDDSFDDEEHMNLGEPGPFMLEQERYGFTEDTPVIAIKHTFNGREYKYYYEWDPDTETPENLITIQSMITQVRNLETQMPSIFCTSNLEESSNSFNGGFIFISDGSKPENGGICIERVWNNEKIESNTKLVEFLQIMDMLGSKIVELIATFQVEEFDEEDLEDIPVRLSEEEYKEYIQIIPASLINKEINSCCTICQDTFEDSEKCHVISCGHAYHEECLKHWLMKTCQRPTCPNCRHDARELCEKKRGFSFTFENFNSNFNLSDVSFGQEHAEGKIFVFGAQ